MGFQSRLPAPALFRWKFLRSQKNSGVTLTLSSVAPLVIFCGRFLATVASEVPLPRSLGMGPIAAGVPDLNGLVRHRIAPVSECHASRGITGNLRFTNLWSTSCCGGRVSRWGGFARLQFHLCGFGHCKKRNASASFTTSMVAPDFGPA